MSETKFIKGDPVLCSCCIKYRLPDDVKSGIVEDAYRSTYSSEVVYEVIFAGKYVLMREADLERA